MIKCIPFTWEMYLYYLLLSTLAVIVYYTVLRLVEIFKPSTGLFLEEAASHISTHKHFVHLLCSCSGNNLIAVCVKILYIETFIEVAKRACVLTFCCSPNTYSHLVDEDALLPVSSYRGPQYSRLLPQASSILMFFFESTVHYITAVLLVPSP